MIVNQLSGIESCKAIGFDADGFETEYRDRMKCQLLKSVGKSKKKSGLNEMVVLMDVSEFFLECFYPLVGQQKLYILCILFFELYFKLFTPLQTPNYL